MMAAVITSKYPSKAPDMLMYLRRIAFCARRFESGAWVTYDQLYRRQASATKSLDWATEDQSIYNDSFGGKAKPTTRCKICLSEHHGADSCPDSPAPSSLNRNPTSQDRLRRRRSAVGSTKTGALFAHVNTGTRARCAGASTPRCPAVNNAVPPSTHTATGET